MFLSGEQGVNFHPTRGVKGWDCKADCLEGRAPKTIVKVI